MSSNNPEYDPAKDKGKGKAREEDLEEDFGDDDNYDYKSDRSDEYYAGRTTEAMRKKHPHLFPGEGASKEELREAQSTRARAYDLPSRMDEYQQASEIGTRENHEAVKDRMANNVAQRDFAYSEDHRKHTDSRFWLPKEDFEQVMEKKKKKKNRSKKNKKKTDPEDKPSGS
jgi:hypothetical protein